MVPLLPLPWLPWPLKGYFDAVVRDALKLTELPRSAVVDLPSVFVDALVGNLSSLTDSEEKAARGPRHAAA